MTVSFIALREVTVNNKYDMGDFGSSDFRWMDLPLHQSAADELHLSAALFTDNDVNMLAGSSLRRQLSRIKLSVDTLS